MRLALPLLAAMALAGCNAAPSPESTAELTKAALAEPHRPLWHYSPPSGWMNDPNGMVWQDGEYHLYYQYYPDDTVWGPMHWAHAVSPDMVNWETLPIALAPDEQGYIFSGSAVVDKANTAGFGADALVAIYTIHDPVRGEAGTQDHESQGIAVSTDKGRSFTKYAGNPVLPNPGKTQDFRDPSVFWDEARGRWVMALSVHDHVNFYASANLKEWTLLSSFGEGIGAQGGVWECPNLFPIALEGTGEQRWVLIQNLNPGGPQGGSGTQYFVGWFDGESFTLDPEFDKRLKRDGAVWLDEGVDNYAGVTWNDTPDGRRLFIGWMSNWLYAQKVPTGKWRSAMTAPRELKLHRSPDGPELRSRPAPELEQLRGDKIAITDGDFPAGIMPSGEVELRVQLPESGGSFALELSNSKGEVLSLGLDASGQYYVDRSKAGPDDWAPGFATTHRARRRAMGRVVTLRILLDRSSAELFADGGRTVMTETFFPSDDFSNARLIMADGAELVGGTAWPLGSIFREPE
ncbi:MAG: glycoside hydrolase family 32 protein [Sphingomonadaceae bacterium]|nr:glycoside hydrolase family 32 protein [Sphingomonadaceae bacterium]